MYFIQPESGNGHKQLQSNSWPRRTSFFSSIPGSGPERQRPLCSSSSASSQVTALPLSSPPAFNHLQRTSRFCQSSFLHPCGSRCQFPLGSAGHQRRQLILFCSHCGSIGEVHRSYKCAGRGSSRQTQGCSVSDAVGELRSIPRKPWGLLLPVRIAQSLWAG